MNRNMRATIAKSWRGRVPFLGDISPCTRTGIFCVAVTCLTLSCILANAVCLAQDAAAQTKPDAPKPDAPKSDAPKSSPDAPIAEPAADTKPTPPPKLKPEKGWLRVTKDYEVWVDVKQKQVIAGGHICLREGLLEMFACPKATKEHEAIVAVHTPARFVHAALLALGAQAGPPVQFDPVYKPAQGTEVVVEVFWRDAAGKEQRVKAQEWVRQVKTGEPLKYPWVFAGSNFWTDEESKERYYSADGGDFICVSNFSTAMLDLPVESSAANETLLFGAYTDRIPPLDTPVFLFLTPKLEKPESVKTPTDASDAAAHAEGAKEAGAKSATDKDTASPQEDAEKPAPAPADKQPEPAKKDEAGKR